MLETLIPVLGIYAVGGGWYYCLHRWVNKQAERRADALVLQLKRKDFEGDGPGWGCRLGYVFDAREGCQRLDDSPPRSPSIWSALVFALVWALILLVVMGVVFGGLLYLFKGTVTAFVV